MWAWGVHIPLSLAHSEVRSGEGFLARQMGMRFVLGGRGILCLADRVDEAGILLREEHLNMRQAASARKMLPPVNLVWANPPPPVES